MPTVKSAELTGAIRDVERQRSTHADESVGKSIESAQAALLKKDPQGALDALKIATPLLDFADAQKQAEWQRIGQAVKKALQQAGATTTPFRLRPATVSHRADQAAQDDAAGFERGGTRGPARDRHR